MKVAAIQMTSGPDVAGNLEQARALLAAAAARAAALAALPENFAFLGLGDADKRALPRAMARARSRTSLRALRGTSGCG